MSNRCNSYFLIQTKHFNLQGVFAGNTYNTHVFVNLTIYMDHFYLDYIIHFILHYIYIHLTSSPWTPWTPLGPNPPIKKQRKKPSRKKPPAVHYDATSTGRTGRTSWRCTKNCWNALKLKASWRRLGAAGREVFFKGKSWGNPWESTKEIYTNIYITDIWILYNGRIRQYGVIFGEQLLGYPPKGIPNFPFERNRHFVQIDVGSWFWDSFFYFQGEISSALPKTNMKPWRSFLLRKAAICPSDSSTNPWPPLITRKKRRSPFQTLKSSRKKKTPKGSLGKSNSFFPLKLGVLREVTQFFPPKITMSYPLPSMYDIFYLHLVNLYGKCR